MTLESRVFPAGETDLDALFDPRDRAARRPQGDLQAQRPDFIVVTGRDRDGHVLHPLRRRAGGHARLRHRLRGAPGRGGRPARHRHRQQPSCRSRTRRPRRPDPAGRRPAPPAGPAGRHARRKPRAAEAGEPVAAPVVGHRPRGGAGPRADGRGRARGLRRSLRVGAAPARVLAHRSGRPRAPRGRRPCPAPSAAGPDRAVGRRGRAWSRSPPGADGVRPRPARCAAAGERDRAAPAGLRPGRRCSTGRAASSGSSPAIPRRRGWSPGVVPPARLPLVPAQAVAAFLAARALARRRRRAGSAGPARSAAP